MNLVERNSRPPRLAAGSGSVDPERWREESREPVDRSLVVPSKRGVDQRVSGHLQIIQQLSTVLVIERF